MSTSAEFIDYILDELSHVPSITTRKLFGEYALYHLGVVVGLACDNTLFIKITPHSKELLEERAEKGKAYSKAKDSYIIDEELLSDKELMNELIVKTMADVMQAKNKTKKTATRQKIEI